MGLSISLLLFACSCSTTITACPGNTWAQGRSTWSHSKDKQGSFITTVAPHTFSAQGWYTAFYHLFGIWQWREASNGDSAGKA